MSGRLTEIDQSLAMSINTLVGRSGAADRLFDLVANNVLFKGLPVMMLLWGLWFAKERLARDAREKLASIIMVAIAAVGVGRALALLLPFRDRPIHSPELGIQLPIGTPPTRLDGWTSMPSDHAVLFFAIAAGLFHVSRRAGLVAMVHAVVVISVPRVYLGLHFPGDMLVGAFVGSMLGIILVPKLAEALVMHDTVARFEAYPYVFYPLMFFVTFQVASMFDTVRQAIQTLRDAAGLLLH